MKKDIVNLGWFLLENANTGGISSEILIIQSNSLRFEIAGNREFPEQVIISVKEGQFGKKPIISQVVKMSDAEDLIRAAWKKSEERNNSKFIEQYGYQKYHELYDSFITALTGESENKIFTFEITSNSEGLNVSLTNKKSGITHVACLSTYSTDTRYLPHGSAQLTATTLMMNKSNEKYQYVTDVFQINIPAVDYYKYKLGLTIKKLYDNNNACDFLARNVMEKDSSTMLAAFLLRSELDDNSVINPKRPKI